MRIQFWSFALLNIIFPTNQGLAQSAIKVSDTTNGTSIAPVEMESITILAPRKDIGQIAHLSGSEVLLREQEIKRFDQVDGNQLLQTLPGVYTQQEDGWGLRLNVGLRGTGVLRSSRVTLMEDGVLTSPAPYSSPSAYYTPAMWKYQNIEILKGSAQLITGPQTTGGAINMVTPVLDEKNDLRISTAWGNFGQNRHAIIGEFKIAPRTSVGIAFNQSGASGFKELYGKPAGGYLLRDGFLKVGHHLDDKDIHHLELVIAGTQERSNQTYLGLTLQDAISSPRKQYVGASHDSMFMDRIMGRFSYTMNLKKGWFRADVYRHQINRNWYKLDKVNTGNGFKGIATILENPEMYAEELLAIDGGGMDSAIGEIKANNREYYSQGIQFRSSITQHWSIAKLTHEAGLRLHSDGEDRFQWTDKYAMGKSLSLKAFGEKGAAGNRIDFAAAQSAYYRATFSYVGWTLQAGLRGEQIRAYRADFGNSNPERDENELTVRSNLTRVLLPGISLNKKLGNWIAFGGIHKGFTPAGSKEGVLPESSINTELGIRHANLPFQITGFSSSYDRLLGSDMAASGGTGTGDMFNGGAALVQGIEARIGFNWKGIEMTANATYTDARFTDSFNSDFEEWSSVSINDRLPYVPQFQGGFILGYVHKGYQVFIQSVYQAERYSMVGLNNADLPAAWVHNVGTTYTFKKWSFKLSVQNLLNTEHVVAARPAGYRLYAPRMVLATVAFEL